MAKELILRPYQSRALDELFNAWNQGARSVVMALPTGAGKTALFMWLMKYAQEHNRKTLFVANRRLLIDQAWAAADEYGVDYGVIMSNSQVGNMGSSNQVASVQTLEAWHFFDKTTGELTGEGLPGANLVGLDECHQEPKRYRQLLKLYPDAKFLCLTATPVGTEGRSIVPDPFDHLIEPVKNSELIRDGFLLSTTVFAPSEPNIQGVGVDAGKEYNQAALGRAVREVTLFADVHKEWEAYQDQATVVFVPGIAYGRDIVNQFNSRMGSTFRDGKAAHLIEAKTKPAERRSILDRITEDGRGVVVSCDVLREGFNLPVISVAIDLQPNSQLRTYWQKVGRIKRSYPGQKVATYLDFAGNYWRFPHPNEDPEWPIGGSLTTQEIIEKKRAEKTEAQPISCPRCFGAGTLVITDAGWLPIEDIAVGQRVLTHLGRWRRVTGVLNRVGEAVRIKGTGHADGLVTTQDHLFLTPQGWEEAISVKEWLSPREVGSPCEIPECPWESTEGLWRFIGCWLGDGWISVTQRSSHPKAIRGVISICSAKTEREGLRVAETIRNSGTTKTFRRYESRTAYSFPIYSVSGCKWLLEHFGQYCHGKKLPSWIYGLPNSHKEALLLGYLEADGHKMAHENGFSCTSVSKPLILGMKLLAQTLGRAVRMRKKPKSTTHVEGRACQSRDQWMLEIMEFTNANSSRIKPFGTHVASKVRGVSKAGVHNLYDISVEEDHSFIAEGIVVHNCGLVRISSNVCPGCGHSCGDPVRKVRMGDGRLMEIPLEAKKKREITAEQRAYNDWKGCLFGALYKGWTYGQCAYIYRKKTGEWPKNDWPGVHQKQSLGQQRRPRDEYSKAELTRLLIDRAPQ